jgi:hypothetical protein
MPGGIPAQNGKYENSVTFLLRYASKFSDSANNDPFTIFLNNKVKGKLSFSADNY